MTITGNFVLVADVEEGVVDPSADDRRGLSVRDRDTDLIGRLREVVARLGEHRDELEEVMNEIPSDTLVPALRHLARVVRRMRMAVDDAGVATRP